MSMHSATGVQLARAELFSFDRDKRIKHRPRGPYEIPIRETRSTPNSTHGLEDREEAMHAMSKLTVEERKIYELLNEPLGDPVDVEQRIPSGDLVRYLRKGYTLVGGSTTTEARADGIEQSYVVVVGKERNQRSYESVGERLGLSARQVRRRVLTANKKLIAAIRRTQ
jgi:hypothetical protein